MWKLKIPKIESGKRGLLVRKILGLSESRRSFAAKAKGEVLEIADGESLWRILLLASAVGEQKLAEIRLELMTVGFFLHFESRF